MAESSSIEWTDATWNPITGCSVVSPGCTNCYAMKLAGGRLQHHPSREGLTIDSKAGPVWNGKVRLNEAWLTQPLLWKRPRRIFVCAHGDLFHESVPEAWIDKVFAIMALAPQHTFQVLTKRAARMRAYFESIADGVPDALAIYVQGEMMAMDALIPIDMEARESPWPLPNVWLGVSAEDQTRAAERIPDLLATPAAVRFLSAEPLLGPIDLTSVKRFPPAVGGNKEHIDALRGTFWTDQTGLPNPDPRWAKPGVPFDLDYDRRGGLDWVIAGGESGRDARPMHPDWVRQIRDDCAVGGVAFHFKQWGAWKEAYHDDQGPTVVQVEVGSEEAEAWLAGVKHPAFLAEDGRRFGRPQDIPEGLPARLMTMVGKRAAGRLLDGVEHNAMPRPTA